ncbi:MAG: hypothetical protein ACREQF_02195 [Candidatus Binataceae bacterium]
MDNTVKATMIPTPLTDAVTRIITREERFPGETEYEVAAASFARQMERDRAMLIAAAIQVVALLDGGRPGWGVSRDILRALLAQMVKP